MSWLQRYQNLEDPLRAERRVELLVVVLLALILLQLMWGGYRAVFPAMSAPVPPTADALEVRDLALAEVVSPEMRAEIRQRPLFWVSRRPTGPGSQAEIAAAEARAARQAGKPGKIEGVKLAGVFGSGDSAGIIVFSKGKKHRVMVDQAINGWTLQSVMPNEALLTSEGKEAKLILYRGKLELTDAVDETQQQAPEKVEKTEKGAEQAAAPVVKKSGKASQDKAGKKTPASEDSLSLGRGARSNK